MSGQREGAPGAGPRCARSSRDAHRYRDADPSRDVYLGIDTATPFLVIGLWSASAGTLCEAVERVERRHAARLIPALETAMASCGVGRSDLAGIAAGAGPGSYTGLRVGAAAAKGLARALDLPLGGCDTLAAIAFGALADGAEGLALLDARRGNVYAGRYRRVGDELETIEAPRKIERQLLLQGAGSALVIEGEPPSAGYVARAAASHSPFQPLYL